MGKSTWFRLLFLAFLLLTINLSFGTIVFAETYLPPKSPEGVTRHITLVAKAVPELAPFDLTFNGTLPGPTIIIDEGDEVFLTLVNNLPNTPVSIHVHGVHYEIESDGTFHTASFAPPGGTYTYHWVAGPGTAGAWHYHDHVVQFKDVGSADRGLFGSLIVRPRGEKAPKVEAPVKLVDQGLFGSIIRDGKETALGINPIFEVGFTEKVRFYLVSEGTDFHNFRIDGHQWVDLFTGRLVSKRLIGPAETYPFDIIAGWSTGPGDWIFSSDTHPNMKGILRVKPGVYDESLASAKIRTVDVPRTQFNTSDIFNLEAEVEYSMPLPTIMRVNIFDADSQEVLRSENRTVHGNGRASFQFTVSAPSVEKVWRLRGEAQYLVGGVWRNDASGFFEELTLTIVSGLATTTTTTTPQTVPTTPAPSFGSPLLLAGGVAIAVVIAVVFFILRRKGSAALIAIALILLTNANVFAGEAGSISEVHAQLASERNFLLVAQLNFNLRPLGWAFNNSVPGPTIVADGGNTLTFEVVNRFEFNMTFQILRGLSEELTGEDELKIEVNATLQIPSGGSGKIAWVTKPSMKGTWYYRDAVNADKGAFGAIVLRGDDEQLPRREFVVFMIGWDMMANMISNGREIFLGQNPTLEAKLGERVRFHIIGEGSLLHTFHIHAHRWIDPGTARVIDTKLIRISQIHVFDVVAGDGVGPGDWMYHCHVVEHMRSGMIGIFRVS